MRCQEFEDRMNDVLDQRALPERDPLLVRHAGECASCRQLLSGQAALFAGLELLETPPLSSRFAEVVLAQSKGPIAIGKEPKTRRVKWVRLIAGFVSLAAVVLVAVYIGFSRQQDPVRPIARPAEAPKVPEIATSVPAPGKVAPEVAKVVLPPKISPALKKEDYQEYRKAIDSLTAQLPTAVEKIDEVQQSSPAIRPLRASFSMAIGTLQRTIPNRSRKEVRPIKPDSGFIGPVRDFVV